MIHEKSRKSTELALRREQAAELHLSGYKQREIAERLSCDVSTVCRDLAAIRKEWVESSIQDYDEKVTLECERLDATEREAWEGWRRSQEPEVTTEEHVGENDKSRTVTKTKEQAGLPAFLNTIINCIKARCQLLGLDGSNANLNASPNTPMTIIFSSAPNPRIEKKGACPPAIEDQFDASDEDFE